MARSSGPAEAFITIPAPPGQMGQTERFDGQHTDIPLESADLSNLSDLSEAGDQTETKQDIAVSAARPD
jgi:hypothetical protein